MWPLPSTGISLNAKGSLESSPVLPRFSWGSGLGWCDVAGMPCDASLCFSIILRSPFRNGFQSACLLLAAIVVWPCLEKATYCLIASDLNVLLRAYGVPLAELLPRCKRQSISIVLVSMGSGSRGECTCGSSDVHAIHEIMAAPPYPPSCWLPVRGLVSDIACGTPPPPPVG